MALRKSRKFKIMTIISWEGEGGGAQFKFTSRSNNRSLNIFILLLRHIREREEVYILSTRVTTVLASLGDILTVGLSGAKNCCCCFFFRLSRRTLSQNYLEIINKFLILPIVYKFSILFSIHVLWFSQGEHCYCQHVQGRLQLATLEYSDHFLHSRDLNCSTQ